MLEVMRFEVRHDEHRHAIEQLLERATAEPSVPFDCKNHVAAKCPTCIAVWARTAENRGEKP